MTPELVRLAYHESGHLTGCWCVGGEITGPASIVSTAAWLGVTWTQPAEPTEAERFTDRGMERYLRASIVLNLAGVQAEKFAPAAAEPPALVAPAAELPAADRELLARAASEPCERDFAKAFATAEALYGSLEPHERYVASHQLIVRLERLTAWLLSAPEAQARLHRCAAALIEHRTLSADAIRQLLEHDTEEVAAA